MFILVMAAAVARADMLPQLDKKPWTGWFAGTENRKYRFGVDRKGDAFLMPMKNREEAIYNKQWIRFSPVIQEIREDGRLVTKKSETNGWTALSEASAEAEKISYRGTVTGGAVFEVIFEIDKNEIRAGGRLVEQGTLTGNYRFAILTSIPNMHYGDKEDDKLEDKAGDDDYLFVRADGEKLKFDGWSEIDASEVNGEGFKSARIDIEAYGAKLDLMAGEDGKLEFWNRGLQRAYRGVGVNWIHDHQKDPEGRSRFTIIFK